MEAHIENFAGVIVQNEKGETLLVRKVDQYAYAVPWCRITPGQSLQQCIVERVMDLTGLTIQPIFLGPSEHIEEDNHFISFDHTAKIDSKEHHYVREGLDYLWAGVEELITVPLVPLTRQILEKFFQKQGIEPELSSEPKEFSSGD